MPHSRECMCVYLCASEYVFLLLCAEEYRRMCLSLRVYVCLFEITVNLGVSRSSLISHVYRKAGHRTSGNGGVCCLHAPGDECGATNECYTAARLDTEAPRCTHHHHSLTPPPSCLPLSSCPIPVTCVSTILCPPLMFLSSLFSVYLYHLLCPTFFVCCLILCARPPPHPFISFLFL